MPISDQIVNLATGDLRVNPADGSLWYGTGEPNYGNELGRGIYRLAQPWLAGSQFTEGDRVGGQELESHWVGKIAFDATYAYAATSRGVYRYPLTPTGQPQAGKTWTDVLHPEPVQDSVTKNIANDIVVQPGTGYLVANLAYRSTLPYNGFYISKDHGSTWTKSKPMGAINPKEVGPSDMAYSADGSALYIVMESTVGFDTKNSALAGVYESKNGNPDGPWSQIADASKLANSGSALKTPGDHSYPVGVQAWYNRFIGVDPKDKNHVYVGLEEVFETHNAGTSWKTIGRYWDFGFPCQPSGTCDHDVLHSDQHSIAFDGTYVYAGNDGGLYRRTIAGDNGWTSLSKDGTLRALQYYGIGVGYDDRRRRGLGRHAGQRCVTPAAGRQGQRPAGLADGRRRRHDDRQPGQRLRGRRRVHQPHPAADPQLRRVAGGRPDDRADRTGRPERAVHRPVRGRRQPGVHEQVLDRRWPLRLGEHQDVGQHRGRQGLDAGLRPHHRRWRPGRERDCAGGPDARRDGTHVEYAGWCGSCSSTTFNNGIATNVSGSWKQLPMKDTSGTRLPKRYISAVTIDPSDNTGKTVYVTFNSFSARYIQGYGLGHRSRVEVHRRRPDLRRRQRCTVGRRLAAGRAGQRPGDRAERHEVPRHRPRGLRPPAPRDGSLDEVRHRAADDDLLGPAHPPGPGRTLYLYDGTFGRGIWKVQL